MRSNDRSTCLPRISLVIILTASILEVSAQIVADGDVTKLTVYEVPVSQANKFLTSAENIAQRLKSSGGDMYLFYRELSTTEGTERFFTVQFPDDINELTEPNTASFPLVAELGRYRIYSELTRQVPAWCSTVSLDAEKLKYAHVQYLWINPNTLDAVDTLLQKRTEIIKKMYGTGSDGTSAFEGFIPMVAAFGVVFVHFSDESTEKRAETALKQDLEAHGLLAKWEQIESEVAEMTVRVTRRSGHYMPELTVE